MIAHSKKYSLMKNPVSSFWLISRSIKRQKPNLNLSLNKKLKRPLNRRKKLRK
jgi:hypothetical protein